MPDAVEHVCGVAEYCSTSCLPPARVYRDQLVTIPHGKGRLLVQVDQVVAAGERVFVSNKSARVATWVSRRVLRSVPAALASTLRKKTEPAVADPTAGSGALPIPPDVWCG